MQKIKRMRIIFLVLTISLMNNYSASAGKTKNKCYLLLSYSNDYNHPVSSVRVPCKSEVTDFSSISLINNFVFKKDYPNRMILRFSNGTLSSEVVVLQPGGKDSDQDGLADNFEKKIGTNPNKADSDEDGFDDGKEFIIWGKYWNDDFDKDGIPNILDPDSDNNGLKDGQDFNIRDVKVLIFPVLKNVSIFWLPNQEPDVANYKVFVRKKGEKYNFSNPIWKGKKTYCKIKILSPGIYYFCIKVYDLAGQESQCSTELKWKCCKNE